MLVQISHSVSVFFSMMTLVIHLVMQSDVGVDKSLSFSIFPYDDISYTPGDAV